MSRKRLAVSMIVVAFLAGGFVLAQSQSGPLLGTNQSETVEPGGLESAVELDPIVPEGPGEGELGIEAKPIKSTFMPFGPGTDAVDISDDGLTVVGGMPGGSCFKYTSATGMVAMPGNAECDVSAIGGAFSGQLIDGNGRTNPAVSTDGGNSFSIIGPVAGVTTGCDFNQGTAYDISGDGQTVVGLTWDGCDAGAFVWEASTGEMTRLDESLIDPTGVKQSRADAVNFDGSVIAGWGTAPFGTRWGAKWVNGVMEWLLDGNGDHLSEANAVSSNGDYIGGAGFSGEFAYLIGPDGTVQRMGLGGTNVLGQPKRDFVTAVTPDGMVVIGFNQDPLNGARTAWIWENGTTTDLKKRLLQKGGSKGLRKFGTLDVPRDISDDGKTLVGFGFSKAGPIEGWVATLP